MILIFLGPPGSGKGTQAKLLAASHKIPHISLGDILREEVKNGTAIGLKAKEIMNAGRLVPDEMTIELTGQRVSKGDCQNGFIVDGFPRSIIQAEGFEKILAERKWSLKAAIYFDLPEEVAVKRLLLRAGLEGRADDNEAAIRTRFEVYAKQTAPLIKYYERQGKLCTIVADQSVEKIKTDLSLILDGNN